MNIMAVRAFKNKAFSRFARKEKIADSELRDAVQAIESGKADADLGSHVYKYRIPRPSEGKSGGYRVIVFFKKDDKAFLVHGFAKKDVDNISDKELRQFKEVAKKYLSFNEDQIKERLKNKDLQEI
jgi:hypothetical protein